MNINMSENIKLFYFMQKFEGNVNSLKMMRVQTQL